MATVRSENLDDIAPVRRVNELAFGQPNEGELVDTLRKVANPHISLVAIEGGKSIDLSLPLSDSRLDKRQPTTSTICGGQRF
jgi:hypothetical protein